MRTYHSKRRKRSLLLPRALAACIPMVFLAAIFVQAVFANTYVITDGSRTITHTTFASDPADILDEAGLELDSVDSYTAGESAITIRRGQRILLRYHGVDTTVSSSGETVEQLLTRLGYGWGENDVITPGLNTVTYDGMQLSVDQTIFREERYSAALPCEVNTCYATSIPSGMEEVLVPGSAGEVLRTAWVTYINGVEVSREVVQETMLSAPVPRLVAVGTGDAAQTAAPDAPVITDSTITLPSGEILTYTHTGTARATAYTHTDAGCNMETATGSTVHIGTVAVDPTVIPYGTRMFIMASDGSYIYGVSEAEDCGGDIKGDRMDLYLPTYDDCIQFGRRVCTIYFLG